MNAERHDDPLRRLRRPHPANPALPPAGTPEPDHEHTNGDASPGTSPSDPDRPHSTIGPYPIGPCLTVTREINALCLRLRHRDGTITALSYHYFTAARYDPQADLELDFIGHAVTIRGGRLLAVLDAITRHRAIEVAEGVSEFDEGGGEPFVESISVVATQER